MKTALLILIYCVSFVALAAPQPLFKNKTETFKILDSKSKAPQFRILNSSVTKKSLAVALNAAFKLGDSQSGVKDYVEVRPENISFESIDDKSAQITLRVSGREVILDQVVPKADLRSGKSITVKVPAKEYEVTMFTVTSKGGFTIRYDAKLDQLSISNASVNFEIDSTMTEEDPETIKFDGKGIRQNAL